MLLSMYFSLNNNVMKGRINPNALVKSVKKGSKPSPKSGSKEKYGCK
jgi:hypothetical protein